MLFPHLTPFAPELIRTINERAGNNLYVSGLLPWMRLTASSGLVMESLPPGDSFSTRYGDMSKSGRVGTDLAGNSIYAAGSDRAYRPSPVIESIGVTFGAGGLTRKCAFDIKCFTLPQAERVMQYFMEPGYTVLVEYGWNTADSISQKTFPLDACAIARFNSYDHVKKKQRDAKYQYDGFMGYITNAGFKSTDGETFTINVELTSIGEVAAYLQQHRGGNTLKNNQNPGGEKFDTADIDSISQTNIGLALFMQMFNRLPVQKQTNAVKRIIGKYDSRGNPFIRKENYINMDDVIRSKLIESLQDVAVASEKEGAEIPEGAPLVSDRSYIRLELAFEILNTYSIELKSGPSSGCSGLGTYNSIIEYKNTAIRACPHIFSHDGSKLYVPNPKAPDFGLVQALTAKTEEDKYSILGDNGLPTKLVNLSQWKDNKYAFPQQVSLSSSDYKWPVDTLPFEAGAGQWGYLKDLYINFEFFVEILNRTNYVAKDIYYEILNGISSAANSMWHFEIVELPSINPENTNQYQLEVVDYNFCGNANFKNAKFRASGVDTPFIESSLSVDLPAAMKNMIIAERSAGQPDVSSEGALPIKTGRLFAKNEDPVMKILSNFEKKGLGEKDTTSGVTEGSGTGKLTEQEIRKQNYDLFMSKATVLPAAEVKDRNGDLDAVRNAFLEWFGANTTDINLENLVVVSAWNDPSLLRKLDLNGRNTTSANNVLLEFTFDFRIHGVSGIKTGDLFEIEDLPRRFKDTVFQVVEVSHALDNNMWTTSVTGKLRKKDELETSVGPLS